MHNNVKKSNRLNKARLIFVSGLVIMFSVTFAKWWIVPTVVHWGIPQIIRLVPDHVVWREWFDIQSTILHKVYIFNVTNHNSVIKGEIPKLIEIGPYVYEQKRTKELIKQDHEKGTAFFRPTQNHVFRPDLSNGTEEDPIVMLNIPYMTVAEVLSTWPIFIQSLAHLYLDAFDEQAFLHTDVGTILFKGVHFPMIESISDLHGGKYYLPNNTFAFFNERNGTMRDILEVDTGMTDSRHFADFKSWMEKTSVDLWDGPTCNMINGSDVTLFAPFIKKQTTLRFFLVEFCRSFHLAFEKEEVIRGIHGYRFSLAKNIYSDTNPDSRCFCMESDKSKCPKSGVVSTSPCRHGAPIYISNPHFLYGDPSYQEPFHLKPDPDKHEFRVTVEPMTGLLLKINGRFQLNARLRPSDSVAAFESVPEAMVPLLWLDEGAVETDLNFFRIRYWFRVPLLITEHSMWILFGVSCILVVLGIFLLLFSPASSSKQEMEEREQEKVTFMT